MSKKLISYSGTTIQQIDLARAKELAIKKAKKSAKGKLVKEDKVFKAVALKRTNCLVLRPNTTEEVSEHELEVIKAHLGKNQYERFVQVHNAPEVPRSLRDDEPKKPEEKPKPPVKTLDPKPGKKPSGKGAV
jgi:hypothetical protein